MIAGNMEIIVTVTIMKVERDRIQDNMDCHE
jgi:hypothetical protein